MTSNQQPPNMLYPVANALASSNPYVVYFADRDPLSTDVNYPVQKWWFNVNTNQFFFLKNYSSGGAVLTANWVSIGGVSILEFTGGTGTAGTFPVVPSMAGEVLLTSSDSSLTITGGVNSLDFTANFPVTDDLHWPKYIVGDTSNGANYSTFASAVAAAPSGETIGVQPGTYFEDFSIGKTLNFIGLGNVAHGIWLTGKITTTSAEGISITFSNMLFLNLTDYSFSLVGNNGSLSCYECSFGGHTTVNASGLNTTLTCVDCESTWGSGSSLSDSAALPKTLIRCQFSGGDPLLVSSTLSAKHTTMSAITTSGSGTFNLFCCETGILTTAGSGTSTAINCNITGGTSSAISVGSGTTVIAFNNCIQSTNTNAITGAGTIQYSNLIFSGSSSGMNTTTQTAFTQGTGSLKFFTASGTTGTSSSNTMTVYEDGTWTPTLNGAVPGTTTYSAQLGYYTRIGSLVYLSGIITISAATGTGNAQIGGIPFPIVNLTSYPARGSVLVNSTTWTWPASTTTMVLNGNAAGTTFVITCTGSGVASAALQMNNSALTVSFNVVYRTA
jgi:hypothetical protein